MTDADAARFAKVLAALGETFNDTISDIRAEAYHGALADLPIELVERAAVTWMKHGKFFPKPAELREQVEGNSADQADLAWMELLREIRRVGYVGQPVLPEATLETVSGLWGNWTNLCQTLPSEGPELLGWAKRFGSAYVATRHRLERPEVIGRAEAQQLHAYYTGGGQQPFPRSLPHSGRAMPVVRSGPEDSGDVLDRDDDV